jgi:hypothetical protein
MSALDAIRRGIAVPRGTDDVHLLARTLRLVLTIPAYAVLGVLAAAVGMTLFVVSQNPALAEFAVTSSLPLDAKVTILTELYPFVGTTYSTLQSVTLLVLAALIGAQVAMLGYHLREHGLSGGETAGSTLGVVLATVGAGCAACGTALLAGLLSLLGVAGLLTLLPYDGLEIGFAAAAVLVLSMYWIADGMRGGDINGCPVDIGQR